jgi:hypothetical protein
MSQNRLRVTLDVPADTPIGELVSGDARVISVRDGPVNNDNQQVTHKFRQGEYVVDTTEPTPSGEANMVEILETTGQRADEYFIDETGKTVAEHNTYLPNDDLVVVGQYPHMGSDKEFAFPESRLRRV